MTAERNDNYRRMADNMSGAPRGSAIWGRDTARRGNSLRHRRSLGKPPRELAEPGLTAQPVSEPAPVWLAALVAAHCEATGNGPGHAVRWDSVSGRAIYTNLGAQAEWIEPLGAKVESGQTLAVSWPPGETSYMLEVYEQYGACA